MSHQKYEAVCPDAQPKRWRAALWDLITHHFCANDARMAVLERLVLARLDLIEVELTAVRVHQVKQTALLNKILAAVLPPAVRAILVMEWEGIARKEGEHMITKVPQNTPGTLSVVLKNSTGGPGHVDGTPEWKAEPEGVVELVPAADGMTCAAKTLALASPDDVKSAVITFTADGDLGDGTQNIVLTGTVTVYDPAGNSVTGELVMSFTGGVPPIEP